MTPITKDGLTVKDDFFPSFINIVIFKPALQCWSVSSKNNLLCDKRFAEYEKKNMFNLLYLAVNKGNNAAECYFFKRLSEW